MAKKWHAASGVCAHGPQTSRRPASTVEDDLRGSQQWLRVAPSPEKRAEQVRLTCQRGRSRTGVALLTVRSMKRMRSRVCSEIQTADLITYSCSCIVRLDFVVALCTAKFSSARAVSRNSGWWTLDVHQLVQERPRLPSLTRRRPPPRAAAPHPPFCSVAKASGYLGRFSHFIMHGCSLLDAGPGGDARESPASPFARGHGDLR